VTWSARKLDTVSDMSSLGPLGPAVLADRAYQAIKHAILSLELEPGTRLVERRLAEQFQISKSPVRDALHRLAGEGLVVQTPYAGMVVRKFSPDFVDELYELREVLEAMAIQLAVPRLTAADVAEAEASFQAAEAAMRANDNAARGEAADRFHDILYRCAGNRPLHTALRGFSDQVRIISAVNWRLRDTRWESHRQHQAIMAAAAAGDAETASELMREHIRRGRTEYRTAAEARADAPLVPAEG
jgi:DNA-binding GntR family transcriptional regulator